MKFKRCYISLIITLLGCTLSHAQERHSEIFVNFRVNSTRIDSTYGDNAVSLRKMTSLLQEILDDPATEVLGVSFCGTASPEGSYQLNSHLAQDRLVALEGMVRARVDIPDSLVSRDNTYIPWEYLISLVEDSDLPHKEEVLDILNGESRMVAYHGGQQIDSRIPELRKIDGGRVWSEMLHRFFSRMRTACMVMLTRKVVPDVTEPGEVGIADEPLEILEPEGITLDDPTVSILPMPEPVAPSVIECERNIYVKTNVLGLGLAIVNAAVEVDFCRRWSFNLPLYYSAWDYFSPKVKFRTLGFYPEMRYWFCGNRRSNDGWFAGAHVGLAWYNVATDGEYRIQDHRGKSPAIGGGIGFGYRLPVSRDRRWKMEFALGGGIYRLYYDRFRNVKDSRKGLLVDTHRKTWAGIDNVSVNVVYTFGPGNKGGAR